MTKEEYLASYRTECYSPSAKHTIQRFFKGYEDHATNIHTDLLSHFRSFISLLLELQSQNHLGDIKAITISYPFSELMCGNPQLLFEIYTGIPFMEHSIVSESFKAPWILPEWEQYTQELILLTRKAGIINAVHEPYIRSTSWALGRDLLHVVSTYIKTQIVDLRKMKNFQKLKIAEDFRITFGEYMGWQRVIFAVHPTIDIFNCEPSDDLTFRTFEKCNYEDKIFDGLNLSDNIFLSCTFKNCTFKNIAFCDSHFDGCDFVSCQFRNIRFDGVEFSGTLFQATILDSIQTNCITQRDGSVFCGFGLASFYNCFFKNAKISNSNWSASTFEVCQAQMCSIESSTISDSMESCFHVKKEEVL